MTRAVICLRPDHSLYDCISKLSKNRISGAPVVNSKKEVVGVVHEKDVTRALDAFSPSIRFSHSKLMSLLFATLKSKVEEDQLKAELQQAKRIKVREIMTAPPVVINHDASLVDAIKIMGDNEVTHVPVVDENSKLVGIIARKDVLRALVGVRIG